MGKDSAVESPLAQLYAVMQHLLQIGEAAESGAVARAARAAQQELWSVIRHHGGSQEAYTNWIGMLRMQARCAETKGIRPRRLALATRGPARALGTLDSP
jgi:hypothetical protein